MNPKQTRSTVQAAADLIDAEGPGKALAALEAQATDLGKVKQTSDEAAQEAERVKNARAAAIVAAWDRKMRKTFRGIVSSPQRYRMMRESYAKREARGEA